MALIPVARKKKQAYLKKIYNNIKFEDDHINTFIKEIHEETQEKVFEALESRRMELGNKKKKEEAYDIVTKHLVNKKK